MLRKILCASALVMGVGMSGTAYAQTEGVQAEGVIEASIELTKSCIVDGGNASGDIGVLGVLDFGTQPALFTNASATVLNSSGAAVNVTCSSGTTASVVIGEGQNTAASGAREYAMKWDGAEDKFVQYDLYVGEAVWVPGTQIAVPNGGTKDIELTGKAYGDSGLPAGEYSDKITVSIDF